MTAIKELEKEVEELMEKSEPWRLNEEPPTREQVMFLRLLGEKKGHLAHLKEMREKLGVMKSLSKQGGRFAGFCAIVEKELFGDEG